MMQKEANLIYFKMVCLYQHLAGRDLKTSSKTRQHSRFQDQVKNMKLPNRNPKRAELSRVFWPHGTVALTLFPLLVSLHH
jgi:hypothetical protein